MASGYLDLPRTLIRGDARLANLYGDRPSWMGFFDWAFAAWAPATVDLGWWLPVDRGCGYDARKLLDEKLLLHFNDSRCQELPDPGFLLGIVILQWDQAQNLKNGQSGAENE